MYLLRIPPLRFESVSSWRFRSDSANQFAVLAGWEKKDPDTLKARDVELSIVMGGAGIPFTAGELHTLCGSLSIRNSKRLRWALPLGAAAGESRSGPLFCPSCLREDRIPHFRLFWRLAFLAKCPFHQVSLIDRCPNCDGGVWPWSPHRLTHRRHVSLRHCPSCDFDLADAWQPTSDRSPTSDILWRCALEQVIPVETRQASTSAELFDALWALAHLLLRTRARKIWRFLPGAGAEVPTVVEKSLGEQRSLHLLPINFRSLVIHSAFWLLGDWPERFLTAATGAGITREHFQPLQASHPSWLANIIRAELTVRRRNVLIVEHVREAIAKMERSGNVVTKTALREALGVTESNSIHQVVWQRRTGTVDEFMKVMDKLDLALIQQKPSRGRKEAFVRDYVIFLLAVLSKDRVDNICSRSYLEVVETCDALVGHLADSAGKQRAIARLEQLNNLYAQTIRPALLSDRVNPREWFITRSGAPIRGHSVRDRIARIMSVGFPTDLWHSADVFTDVFSDEPRQGRRAKRFSIAPRSSDLTRI